MEKFTHLFMCAIIVGTCNADNPLARIVGGNDANIKDHPYMVSLRAPSGRSTRSNHYCAGVIIDKNRILTAAHCFNNFKDLEEALKKVTIHAGTDRTHEQGSVYQLMNIAIHPEYERWSFSNDISVIKLTKPIEFGETQKPIQLPSQDFKNEMVGTVIGWGATDRNQRSIFAKILQKLPLKMYNPDSCKNIDKNAVRIDQDSQFCGYNGETLIIGRGRYAESQFRDACNMDSGGPIVVDNYVVGIVSHGLSQRCATGAPTIFENVYKYLTFIEKS